MELSVAIQCSLSQLIPMTRYIKAVILCGSIKYLIMLILIVISVLFSKDHLQQYASKATSFKQFEEKITKTESVTLILGFWPFKKLDYPASWTLPQLSEQWELGKDFTLSFGVVNYRTVMEKIKLEENNDDLKISFGSIGKVDFKRLIAKWGNHYKIKANIINVPYPYRIFLQIQFDERIPETDIPSIDVRMASDVNSFGATMNYYLDGKRVTLTRLQGFRILEVQPTKVIYLDSGEKCHPHGFYHCLYSQMIQQSYDQCPRKCVPISTYGNALPLCKTVEEFECSMNVTEKFFEMATCLPACKQINFGVEYDYQEDIEKPDAKRNVTLTYRIWNKKMKVYEEYLVEDFVNVLGAIGGTLGLFIGFSILGALNYIYKHIIVYIERFMPKNLNILVDSRDQSI